MSCCESGGVHASSQNAGLSQTNLIVCIAFENLTIKEKLPVRYDDCNRNSEEWSSLWTPNIVSTHLKRKVRKVLIHSITPIQKPQGTKISGMVWMGISKVNLNGLYC